LFAILDVETTGFFPQLDDRIVELALVRLRPDGSTCDEYTTVVNPLRDVGPSHIHGLTQEDVEDAPTFHEIVGDVLARLHGVVLVAHNAQFDCDFLGAELAREGVMLPSLPTACTLKLSYRLHPTLESHRLATCCECAGVEEAPFHSALEDAKATARLLMTYVREAGDEGLTVIDLLNGKNLVFPPSWPTIPQSGRAVRRASRAFARLDPPYMARLIAKLAPTGVNERTAPYFDLLDGVLADRRITVDESHALESVALAWGLTRDDVGAANLSYVAALVAAALDDAVVTSAEYRDLRDVTRLLGFNVGTLDSLIAEHTASN